jgi:putative addiction module component (TIGR02574 family)
VINASTVAQMSLAERLQAMELLWMSLAADPEKVASPEWHKEILAVRLAEIERGEAKFFTLDEVKERLRKPRK